MTLKPTKPKTSDKPQLRDWIPVIGIVVLLTWFVLARY